MIELSDENYAYDESWISSDDHAENSNNTHLFKKELNGNLVT